MTPNLVELLSRTSLFHDLEPEVVGAVASQGHERSYRRGESIFLEGEPSDAFYVIADGTVKVFVHSGSGEQMVFATLSSPESLGDVARFDGGVRSASAEAIEDPRDRSLAARPLKPALTRTLALVQRRDKPGGAALEHVRAALMTLAEKR